MCARAVYRLQMFRWMYFREAYGPDSLQYAQSLVYDKLQNPLGRYTKESYDEAIACLRRHGLYKEYFGTNRSVAWKQNY